MLDWHPKLNATEAIEWTINWYKKTESVPEFTFKQINDYMLL